MKKIALLFILFWNAVLFSQVNYKYVVVPKKFNFFKEENKYNLNSITKSFFEKEAFLVFYEGDSFPKELAENRCLALYANAIENNSLFVTKINFEIKDCYNKVIFTSNQATSREKDLKTAYTLVFREALASMSGKLNFKSSKVSSDSFTSITDEVKLTPEIVSKKVEEIAEILPNEKILFAIPTPTGYKLVNSKPEMILVLYKTNSLNIFIAKKDTIQGVLLKNSFGWFFEYYQNEKLVSEKLEVKF